MRVPGCEFFVSIATPRERINAISEIMRGRKREFGKSTCRCTVCNRASLKEKNKKEKWKEENEAECVPHLTCFFFLCVLVILVNGFFVCRGRQHEGVHLLAPRGASRLRPPDPFLKDRSVPNVYFIDRVASLAYY